ncbi:hypothetical protein [Celerinatantimonas sp. MCCC 1A17872]
MKLPMQSHPVLRTAYVANSISIGAFAALALNSDMEDLLYPNFAN